MENLLHNFIILPLAGFLISLLIPAKRESVLSNLTTGSIALHFIAGIVFIGYWLFSGAVDLNQKDIILFKNSNFEFLIDFSFDKVTAIYFFVGSLLTFIVAYYSSYYMHREIGFKRFFNTILLFYSGYNIIIFSGNLETLFIGWETIGLTSFLLIAFYRNRYLPVKNAVKVFSIYRIGDIGIFLAMWLSHHLFHSNIIFLEVKKGEFINEQLETQTMIGSCIALTLLISALAKSAQVPFSSWLPRAMEGPTPSSAIFYGALSVHIGVFLLLRTQVYWENQIVIRIFIGVIGLITAILASTTSRVQSSIKTKIAYASISQIGLIFIELAFRFENIALLHFAGNAFLRTHQLLISPSVVTYMIRDQFFTIKKENQFLKVFPKKISYSIYLWSVKEWNLGRMMNKFYWEPLKWGGNLLNFISNRNLFLLSIILFSAGIFSLSIEKESANAIYHFLPNLYSFFGLLLVLKSFTERKNTELCWLLILINHLFIAIAVSFNENFKFSQTLIYLSGILICGGIGLLILYMLKRKEKNIDLNQFRGHVYEHPYLAFIFLICCLGVEGFPITPTFLGEELIFDHIHEDQILLALFTSMSFIVVGLSAIRIYARLFLGPHVKTYHEIAYRSS